MLAINSIPEPQKNESSTQLVKELNVFNMSICDTLDREHLALSTRCYFQGSVYDIKFLTWEPRTAPDAAISTHLYDIYNLSKVFS